MKLLIMLILFVVPLYPQSIVDSQINDLCLKIAKELSEHDKKTVAVLEFEFSGAEDDPSELGKYLSGEIVRYLFETKKFKVIERQLLNEVIKEQQLQASDLFDDASAKSLGKLLGVNTIVAGTMTHVGKSVKINARLISTETAEIFATASCELEKDVLILRLLSPNPNREGKNRKSKNAKCQEKNSGDYCFQNDTKYDLNIRFYTKAGETWGQREYNGTVQPGQRQCFYDLDAGSMNYHIYGLKPDYNPRRATSKDYTYQAQGSLYVEVCQEKTFIIK